MKVLKRFPAFWQLFPKNTYLTCLLVHPEKKEHQSVEIDMFSILYRCAVHLPISVTTHFALLVNICRDIKKLSLQFLVYFIALQLKRQTQRSVDGLQRYKG